MMSLYENSLVHEELSVLKFPLKLWRLVNECQSGAIYWGPYGKTILVNFQLFHAEFLDCSLPLFKTKSLSSFIRQLNMYGFRKLTNRTKVYVSNHGVIHEFFNENFRQGRPELLENVKRRTLPLRLHRNMRSTMLSPLLEQSRKAFEENLVTNPLLLKFWNVSPEAMSTGEDGEQMIEPTYQIQAIPAVKTTVNEDGTITVVLSGSSSQHDRLINFDRENVLQESDESDDEYATNYKGISEQVTAECVLPDPLADPELVLDLTNMTLEEVNMIHDETKQDVSH